LIEPELLKNFVLFGWFLLGLLIVIKVARNLKRQRIKNVLDIFAALSGFTSVAIYSPVAHAQISQTDEWKVEESETQVAPIQVPVVPNQQKYIVMAGDNFWSIAKAQAHEGENFVELWREIVSSNENSIKSKNPNLIFPGEEILIRKQV